MILVYPEEKAKDKIDRSDIYYKLAREDGWDFYTGNTINYRENIGKTVRCPHPNPSLGICSSGVIHASKNPNDCFTGAFLPCSVYKVKGKAVCGDEHKSGFIELEILEELKDLDSLDSLFGWRYSEAVNPINPFTLPKKKPTQEDLEDLKAWAAIWDSVGDSVEASLRTSVEASVEASVRTSVATSVFDSVRASIRDSVGASVGASVRDSVGASVRDSVGDSVWDSVGDSVWASVRDSVWDSVGDSVWDSVRDSVGNSVGCSVGAYIGWIFSPIIKEWTHIEHKRGKYPFQPAIDLWFRGLVASYDGKTWRLHGNENAEILYEK